MSQNEPTQSFTLVFSCRGVTSRSRSLREGDLAAWLGWKVFK